MCEEMAGIEAYAEKQSGQSQTYCVQHDCGRKTIGGVEKVLSNTCGGRYRALDLCSCGIHWNKFLTYSEKK